jgi:hypothetical protein
LTGARRIVEIVDLDTGRAKVTTADDGVPFVMYVANNASYQRLGGHSWTKTNFAAAARAGAAAARVVAPTADPHPQASAPPAEQVVELPDRRVNGVVMGAFRTTVSGEGLGAKAWPGRTVTETCIYEKATGRARSCTIGNLAKITYDRYNDPSNVFTIPAAALRAPSWPA